MLPSFVGLLMLVAGMASVCLANVSLVVPGFEPEPLSIDVVGVGANGETTYLLLPGQPTGVWVSQSPAFFGTATLIENADNVVLAYADSALSVTAAESCTLASGMANCLVALAGETTVTVQDMVTPLLVQGGGTASVGPTDSASASVPAQTTPAPGSSAPESSATSSSISPSQSASPGIRLTPATTIAGIAGVMVGIAAVLA